MRFYDREQEIAFLREIRDTAEKVARFTVVTGRRRIGKTTLIREAYKDHPHIGQQQALQRDIPIPDATVADEELYAGD